MTRRRLPSLSSLKAFESFARTGSMTRAAELLNVTHGAVSRQIKALEEQLGAQLVSGPRHGLRLTPAGRELAAASSAAFDLIAAALPGAGAAEEMVVSSPGTFAMKWLIPRLPAFLDAHPNVRVRIVASHAPVDFGQGGLHAAIRIQGDEPAPGVRRTAFMDHFHGPVLSAELLARLGGDHTAVLKAPRLHSETFRPAWAAWAARAGVDLPASDLDREFEHNAYMLEAAAAGLGVAVVPWAFAQADIENGRLAAPWGFARMETRYTYLRPSLANHPAAVAFGAWLVEIGRRSAGPPAAGFNGREHF